MNRLRIVTYGGPHSIFICSFNTFFLTHNLVSISKIFFPFPHSLLNSSIAVSDFCQKVPFQTKTLQDMNETLCQDICQVFKLHRNLGNKEGAAAGPWLSFSLSLSSFLSSTLWGVLFYLFVCFSAAEIRLKYYIYLEKQKRSLTHYHIHASFPKRQNVTIASDGEFQNDLNDPFGLDKTERSAYLKCK